MHLSQDEEGIIHMIGGETEWMQWPINEFDWREQYGYAMREMTFHLDYINRRHTNQQKRIAALKEEIETLKDRVYELEP